MAKITEYQEALGLDQNDVFLKDGTGGTKKIKWETLKNIIAPIDNTLSEAGKAADAGAVGNAVADLKSALTDATGVTLIDDWEDGKRIATNTDPISFMPSSSTSYSCLVTSCSAGDYFVLSGNASNANYRIYCFCTDNGTIVAKPSINYEWINHVLVAPTGATKLVCNSLTASPHKLYKGIFAIDFLEEEINSSLRTVSSSDLWEVGSFTSADGNESPSNKTLRTKETIAYLCRVKANGNYEFSLFAWDKNSGDYIGMLQGDNTFAKTTGSYRDDYMFDPTNGYVYRILLRNKAGTDMSVSEGQNCSVSTALPMENKDEIDGTDIRVSTLEAFCDAANEAIKGTSNSTASASLWEIGSFITNNGHEYPSAESTRMRTKASISHLYSVKTTSSYLFGLYAWAMDGTYIGTLQADGTYAKASPNYVSEIVLDPTNGYLYRILLKKSDNTAFADTSDGANVVISTSLPMDNKTEIDTIKQEIEPMQFLVPKLFPADGVMSDALTFYAAFDALADWQEITNGEFFEYGFVEGGYVDSHIEDYQNYQLRAYYLNGKMNYVGFSSPSSNGYAILSPYTGSSTINAYGNGLYQRKKVLITSGMHGNEKATPNVLREFVRNLINNPEYADLLTAYEFCFIPLANPYGYSTNHRWAYYYDSDAGEITKKDMNTDFPQDGTQQVLNESKFIEQTFLNGEYDLVIDLHQHNLEEDEGSIAKQIAFGGVTLKPGSTISAAKYYRAIAGGAIYAQNEIRSIYNISNDEQTMMAWDRSNTNKNTFREYAVGTRDATPRHKAEMAAISETSTTCYLYSGTKEMYNPISLTVCSVFDNEFVALILRMFMDES